MLKRPHSHVPGTARRRQSTSRLLLLMGRSPWLGSGQQLCTTTSFTCIQSQGASLTWVIPSEVRGKMREASPSPPSGTELLLRPGTSLSTRLSLQGWSRGPATQEWEGTSTPWDGGICEPQDHLPVGGQRVVNGSWIKYGITRQDETYVVINYILSICTSRASKLGSQ